MSSSLLEAWMLKDALILATQDVVISGEINTDKWIINLGVIPAEKFDTLFIPRLVQAFAERLSCEQTSIANHQGAKMTTSNATESIVLLGGYHLEGKGLIELARCCLTPQIFETLLQDSSAYQLQQLLKLFLEGDGQSSKGIPVFWYNRVTVARLSIAALLYLLKCQWGHDWLEHQHAPTASQVTDWAIAIARAEVPPEQVLQLLTGNRSLDSISPGQPAYPPLLVMRWLLPLWRQPAVRKVIHRLNGRLGVHRLDAYLSRCLQRQDDIVQEEAGIQSVPERVTLPQDNAVLFPDWGVAFDAQQVARSRYNATLSKNRGGPSGALQIALSRDNVMMPESGVMPIASRRTMPSKKGSFSSANEPCSSSLDISNAGLLLLWPLLPQLFSQLGLREEEQFVSDAARWHAVYCLDRLVWGVVKPTEERLTLNQMLCGVSSLTAVPPRAPLSLEMLQQIDDWLTAIGQQLPGWQKLSLTDIRQMFLQRAGEISTEGVFPLINVWPEPYDVLLKDWLWPMTLASFPWTEQPLTIVWPLNGFTG